MLTKNDFKLLASLCIRRYLSNTYNSWRKCAGLNNICGKNICNT